MFEIFELIITGLVGASAGYFITKKLNNANFNIYLEQAKAKANVIEHEAKITLEQAKLKAKDIEVKAKGKFDDEVEQLKKKFDSKVYNLEKKEENLTKRLEEGFKNLTIEREDLKRDKKNLSYLKKESTNLIKDYNNKLEDVLKLLEKTSGLTKQEAKIIILKKVEESSRAEISHIVRKYENEAKNEARKKANYILAQATTRYAGEFAAERLINIVHIKDDELKGRIIGKEGRNIKTLELLLGVDIMIDDTPNAIILSSFNLYRRAVATKTIQLLVEDGRIQPSRIEEIYDKVKKEFEEQLLEEGENILIDLGINGVHPELIKLIGRLKFRASYGQNALGHSLEVAHLAGIMAAEMGGNELLAKRAGLLHDIGKALTHEMKGNHIELGAEVCKRYKEDEVVINAIYAHHGHQEALTIEAAAVCSADALSAARPGARREVLESFLKRVQDIENIALSKKGVTQAYAINAGREIRVILNSLLVNDDESALLAKEIAKEIEEKVQYPGEIKVNVIREVRNIEFAK
jgi:ribonuclease Y